MNVSLVVIPQFIIDRFDRKIKNRQTFSCGDKRQIENLLKTAEEDEFFREILQRICLHLMAKARENLLPRVEVVILHLLSEKKEILEIPEILPVSEED
jgi:hypothetical protein